MRKCMCFILSTITVVRCPGAKVGPLGTNNTLSSAPSAEQVDKRHITDCLWGSPAVARLGSLLFLPGLSGGLLRRRIHGDLGPGFLALLEGVVSCQAWTPSILLNFIRSGLRSGWCWLSLPLSLCRFRATGGSRRAGAFWEEVSHRLRWFLSLREAFCKALHSWSKQAAWRDRSVEEGNLVCLFHLRHREPEVAFQHYQAGHRPPDGLGVGFGGA